MKDHNRRDHRIAGTEHATLRFADGTETRIADWQIIENAPTPKGHVYQTLRGWIASPERPGPAPRRSPPRT